MCRFFNIVLFIFFCQFKIPPLFKINRGSKTYSVHIFSSTCTYYEGKINEELIVLLDKYDKRRTFWEAQKGHKQAVDAFQSIHFNGTDYGSELKHLKQEVNEAYQQIQTALSSASEHQRVQLEHFEQDLQGIISEINGD